MAFPLPWQCCEYDDFEVTIAHWKTERGPAIARYHHQNGTGGQGDRGNGSGPGQHLRTDSQTRKATGNSNGELVYGCRDIDTVPTHGPGVGGCEAGPDRLIVIHEDTESVCEDVSSRFEKGGTFGPTFACKGSSARGAMETAGEEPWPPRGEESPAAPRADLAARGSDGSTVGY